MANPVKIVQKIQGVNDQLADFIANGPSDGLPGWVRDQYRDRCNQFANLPGWARALGGPAKHQMNAMCSPYWADNGWDGPANPGPPFTGGQCPVNYVASLSWTQADSGCNTINSSNPSLGVGPGPINIRTAAVPPFSGPDNQLCPGFSYNQVFVSNANGESLLIGAGAGISLNSFSVTPELGGPDNCGNPPNAPLIPGPNPPPNPPPTPGPEPFDDPSDPTGPPIIPIPPYEDPVFGPIPIDAPEDSPAGGGPASGGDGLPGSPDAVGPDAGGANGGEPGEDVDFGEPPAGRVWVGCVVTAAVDPRYGTIPGTAPGNAVYPTTLGNASLIYDGFRGTSTRVLSEFTSLFRPVSSVVLTGCRVSSLPGVNLTVRPISAETCPDNPCEETDG